MQYNSREGFILTTALIAVTVLVTILLHNKVNNAIERRAKSLTSNELKTFGNMIENNSKPTRQFKTQESVSKPVQSIEPVQSIAPVESPISGNPEIPKSPPPVGSGKKWTPL